MGLNAYFACAVVGVLMTQAITLVKWQDTT